MSEFQLFSIRFRVLILYTMFVPSGVLFWSFWFVVPCFFPSPLLVCHFIVLMPRPDRFHQVLVNLPTCCMNPLGSLCQLIACVLYCVPSFSLLPLCSHLELIWSLCPCFAFLISLPLLDSSCFIHLFYPCHYKLLQLISLILIIDAKSYSIKQNSFKY